MYFGMRALFQKLGQTLGIMAFAMLTLYGKDPGHDYGLRLSGNYTHQSEEELVACLQRNDRGAYEYLYDHYSAALYGVIHRVVAHDETANDVLQEAFVKIWNGIGSYDAKKGKLFTWMLNISRNMAIDKTRSKDYNNNQKNQSTENVVSQIGRLKTDSIRPDHIGLAEIVDKLDPNEKFLIDLTYFKGYTQSEIAEEYISLWLSEAERREVEYACIRYPEIQSELNAIEAAINGYARSHARTPDPALRGKILAKLDLVEAPEPKVIQMNPSAAPSYRWLAAASVALFLISSGVNLYLYNQYQSVTGQIAELQSKNSVLADNNTHLTKQVTTISDDLTAVSSASNVRVELEGLPLSPAARALIFWDKERKATYINTSELPPLAQEKQYQLWAIVDGKPVDLGVLPTDKQQTALLKVKDVSAPQAFAITIEPKGGSVNPTMDQMIVLGKL
ncbi:unnamed protein product [Sphagnum jensenii]|uniref:Uncharacterized protein n=1 Tax=Sphagnum jensenii TaxID=128206 RepID=A0ABP0VJ19_9BRYO